MTRTLADAFYAGFLGHAPAWYKHTIVGFLLLNPLLGGIALGGPQGDEFGHAPRLAVDDGPQP